MKRGDGSKRNNRKSGDRSSHKPHPHSGNPKKRRQGKGTYNTNKNQDKHFERPKKGFMAIRLNRYIANSGVCSRREADELIKKGQVAVNGKVVTELGTKVLPRDEVTYKGRTLKRQENVYILVNKPKDYLSTVEDPEERKTVMQLVKDATNKRVYPVGRLDRNTTGVLLLTNDGELTKKLTHPRYNVAKVYDVELDKNIDKGQLQQLVEGIQLNDGFVAADAISYPEPERKNRVGVELHSGKNRVIRRMFEHLGYDVKKLDRVMFAGLTKKNVKRGHWRYLTEKEVNYLYMMPNKENR